MVNALNTAHAGLSHFLQYPQIHPERLFFELLRLAGSLLTFSTAYEVDQLPAYKHHNLQESFTSSTQFYVIYSIRLFRVVTSVLPLKKFALHIGWEVSKPIRLLEIPDFILLYQVA